MDPNDFHITISVSINPDDPRFMGLIDHIGDYMEWAELEGELSVLGPDTYVAAQEADEAIDFNDGLPFISELEREILMDLYRKAK